MKRTLRHELEATEDTQRQWLLVTIVTGTSSTLRVHAWRRLRSLGALYLQSSVSLLPDLPATRKALARLVERVRSEGGDARLLTVQLADAAEQQAILDEFCAERSEEYGELVARCSRTLIDQLAASRDGSRITFAEIEESEAEIERLRKWLARIEARDYFQAPGRDDAEAAISRCQAELAECEARALTAASPQDASEGTITTMNSAE